MFRVEFFFLRSSIVLIFLCGVVYGVVSLVVAILFLALTLSAYVAFVDDFSTAQGGMDTVDAFQEMISRLGISCSLGALVVAFLWPVSVPLYVMLAYLFDHADGNAEETWVWKVLLWVFLGFGKFKPEKKEQATA